MEIIEWSPHHPPGTKTYQAFLGKPKWRKPIDEF